MSDLDAITVLFLMVALSYANSLMAQSTWKEVMPTNPRSRSQCRLVDVFSSDRSPQ